MPGAYNVVIMIHPDSAYQSLESGETRVLFTLFNVPWTATKGSWQFITSRLLMGFLIAFITFRDSTLGDRVLWGLLFGFLVGLSNFLHILGHHFGGKLAGAPMDENLVTKYSILTAYHEDPFDVPGWVHLARAAGGPLMTLAICVLSGLGWRSVGGPVFAFLSILNLFIAVQVSLPIPGADGEVILRELRRKADRK